MAPTFRKDVILKDGTEVQIRLSSDDCYNFFLVSTDGKEDTFTWDATKARDVQDANNLSECEQRRSEALQELWKEL